MEFGIALGNLGLAMGGPVDPVAHADLVYAIAEAAEALGFDAVWAGDHLALPRTPTTPSNCASFYPPSRRWRCQSSGRLSVRRSMDGFYFARSSAFW